MLYLIYYQFFIYYFSNVIQDQVPDVVLIQVLSYLPTQSYLPICHVSKQFHHVYLELKRQIKLSNASSGTSANSIYETNPFAIGNLFQYSWCDCDPNQNDTSLKKQNQLNLKLLSYYVMNGFGGGSTHKTAATTAITASGDKGMKGKQDKQALRKVMLQTASRGDIDGMWFMAQKGFYELNDEEICTTAGAAGQLDALMWLRGDKKKAVKSKENDNKDNHEKNAVVCPWDPTEVHREAAENSHDHIIEYVEKNCDGHDIQMHYGVGLPW